MDLVTKLNVIALDAWFLGDLSTVIRVSFILDNLKKKKKEKILREICEENEIDREENQLLDMAGV